MNANIEKILVDTSFLAKFLGLDPSWHEKAVELVDGNKMIAPILSAYELGNVF